MPDEKKNLEENCSFGNMKRERIILTAIGSIIILIGVFVFGYASKEFYDLLAIGGIFVLVGLIGVPIITWQIEMAKDTDSS